PAGGPLTGSHLVQSGFDVVGTGVEGRMRLPHLILVRSLTVVTFGWAGSVAGWWSRSVSTPQPSSDSYSSASPNAVCPISWSAISTASVACENTATPPPEPP